MSIGLATLGFTIAGILFLIYAFSFRKAATESLKEKLSVYSFAYVFLGIAFLFWGIVTFIPSQLQNSVIIGDSLLLLGSVCLLSFIFAARQSARWVAIVVGLLASALFVWWRITYFFPAAVLQNGILIFNTQMPVAILLGLIFLAIWLPANLRAARLIGRELNDPAMTSIYLWIYIFSTIMAILFISVKTPTFVVVAFVMLGLCFVLLLYSNLVQKKLYKESHGRK